MLYYAYIYPNNTSEVWRVEIDAYNEEEAFEIARDVARLGLYCDEEIDYIYRYMYAVLGAEDSSSTMCCEERGDTTRRAFDL